MQSEEEQRDANNIGSNRDIPMSYATATKCNDRYPKPPSDALFKERLDQLYALGPNPTDSETVQYLQGRTRKYLGFPV